eukprot:1317712-Heterocapsa_arctica.AAC.1
MQRVVALRSRGQSMGGVDGVALAHPMCFAGRLENVAVSQTHKNMHDLKRPVYRCRPVDSTQQQ